MMPKLSLALLATLLTLGSAYAITPVDVTGGDAAAPLVQDNTAPPVATVDTSRLTLEQRLKRLEGLSNTSIQNQQLILQLQTQIEALQGDNDILKHQLQTLSAQLSALQKATPAAAVIPPVNATANTAAPASGDDYAAYQKAYALMIARKYDDAAVALQNFVKTYPSSAFAANATYWQAEIAVIQGKKDVAQSLFSTVVSQYPSSNKVPDSLLRLGKLAVDRQDLGAARQNYEQVIKDYPTSSAAKLAQSALDAFPKP